MKRIAKLLLVGSLLVGSGLWADEEYFDSDDMVIEVPLAEVTEEDKYTPAELEKLCNSRKAKSCLELAELYADGDKGLKKDMGKTIEFATKACDSGDFKTCSELGEEYIKGEDFTKDIPKGLVFLAKACDGGYHEGCQDLGVIYAEGKVATRDTQKAVTLFAKGCDGGNAEGCTHLAVAYLSGEGVAKDEKKALAFTEKACDYGDLETCKESGDIYLEGKGVVKDEKKAVAFYKKACDKGDTYACNSYYTREGDIVINGVTGLMWQDDIAAKTVTKEWLTKSNWKAKKFMETSGDTATTYCSNLKLGGYDDWRLPISRELETIVEKELTSKINSAFVNIAPNLYWTDTSNITNRSEAKSIDFADGETYRTDKFETRSVRCVRGS